MVTHTAGFIKTLKSLNLHINYLTGILALELKVPLHQ